MFRAGSDTFVHPVVGFHVTSVHSIDVRWPMRRAPCCRCSRGIRDTETKPKTVAEEGKPGTGRNRLCCDVLENPGVQPATFLGRANGQRTLASGQGVQGNDPALDIQAGQGDLEVRENRTRNHPHVGAPGEAIEVVLGARLVDRPGDEFRQDHTLTRPQDVERQHGQGGFAEAVIENGSRVRFASGAEEDVPR